MTPKPSKAICRFCWREKKTKWAELCTPPDDRIKGIARFPICRACYWEIVTLGLKRKKKLKP